MGAGQPAGGERSDGARDPRLDGLRGLAIALVMLYHTTQYGLARGPVAAALTAVPSLGWSGVDLFFVLSGFLITGILLEARGGSSYYRAFYGRRVLRIFPLYYAVLVFFLVLLPHIELFSSVDWFWLPGSDRRGLWFWLYLSNFHVAWTGSWQHQTLDITWSLAIEEHFYLLWPFVVRHVSERRLLWICGATIAGALALRAALVAGGAPALAPYVLTPCRLDTLATGAAIAIWVRRDGLAPLARVARVALPLALAAFGLCWIAVRARVGMGGALPSDYVAATEQVLSFTTHPLMQTVGYTLLCALYGSLLIHVAAAPARSWRARLFQAGWLRSLGKYSYALYLFHFFVAMLVLGLFTPARHPDHYVPAQILFWALAIGASYGLARLSWLAIEAPALRLKRYFPYRV